MAFLQASKQNTYTSHFDVIVFLLMVFFSGNRSYYQ